MEDSAIKIDPILIAYEWGRSDKGDPISRPHGMLVKITTEALDPGSIEAIEECGEAMLVLTDKGTLYTCGSNRHGILGIPELNLQASSKELREVKFEKSSITEISVGARHVLALTREGKVYSWGSNNCGQIGKPNEPKQKNLESLGDEQAAPMSEVKNKTVSVPAYIHFDLPISKILAVDNSSYALDEQGQIWSWGREQYIGRASGTTEELNEDGDKVTVAANHVPRRVNIMDLNGVPIKIKHMVRKGKKVMAFLEGNTLEKSVDEEAHSEESKGEALKQPASFLKPVQGRGDDISAVFEDTTQNKSRVLKKKREVEHEQAEYNLLKELIFECKVRVIEPMMAFQKELQERVDDFNNFVENPFGEVLNDDNSKNADGLAGLKKKPLHIDMKKGTADLDIIFRDFNEIKKRYASNISEVEGNRYSEILFFMLRNMEDSIKLRKLALLAFKLHGYHLRLKHKNVLSLASSSLLNEWSNISELTKRMKDILGECEYITKRFTSLQGELNKAYDDKVNSVVSRTAYHMIDTTYSECQAWKYVNIIGEYAVIYRTGYDNFYSISEKMERLYGMYSELKKGDVYQVAQAYKTAVASAAQKVIIEKGRSHIISTNDQIIMAKPEICVDGIDGEGMHKRILSQAYEILVDSAILRIAYYDLFLSYYDQLVRTQGLKQANATIAGMKG
eukprot:TRINITY_DN17236_c0_g2_i6.p1 TRINITY_DN17236_c0_g2~~TRINITY_DN17236_c0_g2_i6.p1  ORF type:complete len:679 (+),score=242.60 TRINITY_DN17236_c0_g2_i6:186-2222(+)